MTCSVCWFASGDATHHCGHCPCCSTAERYRAAVKAAQDAYDDYLEALHEGLTTGKVERSGLTIDWTQPTP